MAYESKPGQGVMFPRNHEGFPNRPDFSGSININGHEYDIAAWNKTSPRGNPYLSILATEPYRSKQQQQGQGHGQYQQQQTQVNQPHYQQAPPQYHPQQYQPQPQNAPEPPAPTKNYPF